MFLKAWYGFQALLTAVLAVYDFRTRRVPNEIVLPWLFVALVWNMSLWPAERLGLRLLFPLALFVLWHVGALGGGDAKVWLSLWLTTPPEALEPGLLVAGLCLFLGGLVVFVRMGRGAGPFPAAWKAVPYGVWLAWTVWH